MVSVENVICLNWYRLVVDDVQKAQQFEKI